MAAINPPRLAHNRCLGRKIDGRSCTMRVPLIVAQMCSMVAEVEHRVPIEPKTTKHKLDAVGLISISLIGAQGNSDGLFAGNSTNGYRRVCSCQVPISLLLW